MACLSLHTVTGCGFVKVEARHVFYPQICVLWLTSLCYNLITGADRLYFARLQQWQLQARMPLHCGLHRSTYTLLASGSVTGRLEVQDSILSSFIFGEMRPGTVVSCVSDGSPVYPVYVMSCIHLCYVSRQRGNPGHVTETLVIQTQYQDVKACVYYKCIHNL